MKKFKKFILNNLLRKKVLILSIFALISVFSVSIVNAANPIISFNPRDVIKDPGSLFTPWGGCGPTDSNCYILKKTTPTKKVKPTNTSKQIKNIQPTTVSRRVLISALRNLLSFGLPTDILEKLRGPAGPKGDKGEALTTSVSSGYTPLPARYIPGAIIPPNPSINYAGGSIFSATELSSNHFVTNTSKITTLTVLENSSFTGNINSEGSLTLSGSAVLGTDIDTTNTIGSGANSNNTIGSGDSSVNTIGSGASSTTTIGSTTTPGAITLHGETTLDDNLNVTKQIIITNTPSLAHVFTSWPTGTSNISDSTLYINPASSVTDGNLIGAGIAGVAKFIVDAEGDVYAHNIILEGSVTSATSTVATLNVTDNTTLGDANTDTVTIHGATTLDNNFSQTGANTFSTGTGSVSLNGNTTVTGTNTFTTGTGATTLGGTLNTTGATTLSSTLGVTGNTTIGGTLGVTGNQTNAGTLSVTGNTTISGTLRAQGPINQSSLGIDRIDIGVQDNTPRMVFEDAGSTNWLIDNSLGKFRWYVPGYEQMNLLTSLNNATLELKTGSGVAIQLNTAGSSYFNGGNIGIGTTTPSYKLDIAGTLNATGATTLSSTLGVTGNTTIGGTLGVTGNQTNAGTLAVTGNTTISGTLTASNGFTLSTGALNMTANSGALNLLGLSASSINTGVNDITFTSSNFNTTSTGINNTAIGSTTPSTIDSTTLTSSGNTTLGTDASTTNSIGSGASSTNTIGSGASSTTTIGSTTTPGAVTIHGATTLDNNFSQTGANTFSTGTGAVSLNGDTTLASGKNFAQNGTGTFGTGTGNVSLNGNTTVTGSNTFTTGTGATTINGTSMVLAGANTSLDMSGIGTLSINTITNRPVTFGTGVITIPNFTATSSVTLPSPFTLGSTSVTTTGTQLNYLSSAIGTTGSTSSNLVFSSSPTLITPNLGDATATTINKITLTQPATGSTLTIADGKTLTASNTITLSGTDGTVMTFPSTSATLARTDAGNTFTGDQTINGNLTFTDNTYDIGASSATRPRTGYFGTSVVSPSFVGELTGNSSTATALQTARTIGGVSFDGTANITVASATGGFTISGGNLALGINNIMGTGSIGSTLSRLTKGWFTDLEVTNAIVADITGNAATVTTNANLTGPITSVGNATSVASQTGTGSTFVMDTSPTITSPTFSTSITGSYLTASELLATNASKNIISLPVATYPSLTELSYVKGVTSSVQTQIGTKANLAGGNVFTGDQTFDTDTLFVDSVNHRVGIGTVSPTAKLDVDGTGTGTIFSASRDTKVNGYLNINFLNQDTNFDAKEDYSFSRGGVELMKIQSNGNVGIGTTSPAYKLDVNGITSTNKLYIVDGTDNYIRFSNNGKNTHFTGSSSSYIWSGQGASGDYLAGTLNLQSRSSIDRDINFITGALPSKRMTIAGNGNVGIGTTTPGAKLEVNGEIRLAENSPLKWGTTGTRIFGNSNYMRFQVGAADRLNIESSGIGIGTTTPRAKLEVKSGATARVIGTNNDLRISSYDTGTYGALAELGFDFGGFVTSAITAKYSSYSGVGLLGSDLIFSTKIGSDSNLTPRLTIKDNGNVGIGTTSPSAELHVFDNSSQANIKIESSAVNGNANLNFITASDTWALYADESDSQKLKIWNGIDLVTFQPDGNVGIGTTNPNSMLEVRNSTAEIVVNRQGDWAGGTAGIKFATNDAVTDYWTFGMQPTSTNTMFLKYNSANIMTVLTSGNIGIGTTNPQNKLDIEGGAVIGATYSGTNTAPTNGLLVEGNVGIGTTAPGAYKLNVNGTGYFSGTLTSGAMVTGSSTFSSLATFNGGINSAAYLTVGGVLTVNNTSTFNGNININTNGTSILMSSYKGANSDGNNIFIGGGGQSSIGAVGATYKGGYNTTNGYNALYSNTTGYYNTANGYTSLFSNTTGNYNTANGMQSLYSNTTGYQNTANGMQALYSNTTGYRNTANGYQAGRYIADGTTANQTSNNSLYLGYNSMALASGDTNEIVIGASAVGVGSNSVVLGNDSITKTILKGNVGIGTPSPGTPLEISSVSGHNLRLTNTGTNSGMEMVTSPTTYSWLVGANNFVSNAFEIAPSTTVGGTTFTTPVVTVLQSGNVGIGTTAPGAYKLNVNGVINSNTGLITSGYSVATSGLNIEQGINSGYAQLNVYNRTTSSYGSYRIDASNLLLNTGSSGSVGIGTTTPQNKLQVEGTLGITPTQYSTGTASQSLTTITGSGTTFTSAMVGSQFVFADGTSAGTITAYTSATSLTVSTSQTVTSQAYDIAYTGLQVDSSGNVGIGTTTPTYKLDIGSGNIRIGGSDGSLLFNLSEGIGRDAAQGNLYLMTAGSQKLTVERTTGNVGIGTTSPGAKLDVNGSINIADGSYYKYGGQNALRLAKGTDVFYANTYVGLSAGNPSSTKQTAIGYVAGYLNTGASQTALGYYAGYLNTGDSQTAIGMYAGQSNTGASQTALGYYAGRQNTGASQTAIGMYAGQSNTGAYQTAIGYYAGLSNTGTSQTALGYAAGYLNTGASQTAIGMYAGQSNTGAYQTAIGYYAGLSNTGDQVIGIGHEATRSNIANDVVAIGYQAGKSNTVANQFIVKQTNINAVPLIQGDFATGNVGIGTTSPGAKLDVVGSVIIQNAGLVSLDIEDTSNTQIPTINFKQGGITKASIEGGVALSSRMDFSIAGFSRMMTLNNGKVGIGTTSPGAKLDIIDTGTSTLLNYRSKTSSTLGSAGSIAGRFIQGYGSGATGDALQISSRTTNANHYLINAQYSDVSSDMTGTSAFVVRADGNVGIGTGSPSALLHLSSDVPQLKIIANTPNTNDPSILLGLDGFSDTQATKIWYDSSGGSTYIDNLYDNNVGDIRFRTKVAGTPIDAMTIDGSGSIGIGTTTPQNKLQVEGTLGITPSQYSTGTASQSLTTITGSGTTFTSAMVGSQLVFADGTSAGTITAYTSATSLEVSTSQTVTSQAYKIAYTGLQVDSTGNVGIGTGSPGYKLEVTGSGIINSAVSSSTDDANFRANAGSSGSPALYLDRAGVNKWRLFSKVSSGDDLYLRNSAGTNIMVFDQSTGNVGIGTTSPGAKLEVKGNIRISDGSATKTTGDLYSGLEFWGTENSLTGGEAVHSKITPIVENVNGDTVGLAFFTNLGGATDVFSEKMRIAGSGNVGIGTTSPVYKLDVNGDIFIPTANNIYFGNSANHFKYSLWEGSASTGLGIKNSAIASTGHIYFSTSEGEKVRITRSGNVGIGTSSPSSKLEVAGDTYSTGRISLGSDITNRYFEQFGDGIKYYAAGTHLFESGSGEQMRILGNGNVGIGTTSPGQTLSVVKSGAAIRLQNSDVNALTEFGIQNDARVWTINTDGGRSDSFTIVDKSFSTTPRFLIDTSGNVGIGTSSPSQKLDVAGNINFSTNGDNTLISNYKGANSSGYNIFIGGGGQSSIGEVGATYKGAYNTAVGYQALQVNTTGYYNTANGFQALYHNTTGYYNTANGYASLYYNTTGNQNTANGLQSLYSNTTGYYNTANGLQSLYSNTTGVQNTANGYQAGRYIADGSTANQTSNNSLYLGYNTMALASGDTNEIVIGASAVGVGSNSVVLGNDSITKTVLKGNVGIGTGSPTRNGLNVYKSSIPYVHLTNSITGDLSSDGSYFAQSGNNALLGNQETNGLLQLFTDNDASKGITIKNGNVGIGTTTPQNKLQVEGTLGITPSQYSTGTASQSLTTITGSGTTFTSAMIGSQFVFADGTSAGTITAYTSATSLTVSTSQTVTSQAYDIAYTGLQVGSTGNVGIGTNNPSAKLDVVGSSSATSYLVDVNSFQFIVQNTNATIGTFTGISFGHGTDNYRNFIGSEMTTNSGDLVFGGRSTAGGSFVERMRLNSSGNLGIGTTTPKNKLDISGGAVIGATYSGTNTAPTNGLLVEGNVGIGTVNPNRALDIQGIFGVQYNDSVELLAVNPTSTGIDFGIKDTSGSIVFRVDDRPGQETAWYNGAGNFGIGTTTPTGKLHIQSASSGATANTLMNDLVVEGTTNVGISILGDDLADTWLVFGTATDGVGAKINWDYTNNWLRIGTERSGARTEIISGNGVTGITLDSNQNVGIGTSSPQNKLDISGGAVIGATYSGTNTAPTNGLLVEGNVGIGTTTPTANLQVAQGTSGAGTVSTTATGTTVTGVGTQFTNTFKVGDTITVNAETQTISAIASDTSLTTGAWTGANSGLAYTLVGGTRFSVLGNGNVGIGTASPSYTLQVGNTSVSGIVARFQNSTGTCDINPTTTSLVCSSDINLKKNITTLDSNNTNFILNTLPDMSTKTTYEKILSLTPVRYNWNSENDTDPKHIGFIAQEMEQVFPDIVSTDINTGLKAVSYTNMIPYTIQAIQEMSLKIEGISDMSIENSFRNVLVSWFADASNTIGDFYANRVRTKELCVSDTTGETCITKSQLDTLLGNSNMAASSGSTSSGVSSTGSGSTTTITADTTPPVITINGNTTINIAINDTYIDQGATANDNIDGDITSQIIATGLPIDTSSSVVYFINYNVADTAGNNAIELTRTVIVGDAVPTSSTTTTDLTSYNQALSAVTQADYTTDSWTTYQSIVTANTVTTSNTQTEVDTATTNITNAQIDLVAVSTGSTNTTSTSGGSSTTTSSADTTPPVITITGSSTVELNVGDTYVEEGATATDDTDTNISIVRTGTVDTTTVGTYTITYNATDQAGNNATEVTRTVNVNAIPTNLTSYNQALSAVTQADYTTDSWTTYQSIVNANVVTTSNTQTEVDTATSNITNAQANLVIPTPVVAPTPDPATTTTTP